MQDDEMEDTKVTKGSFVKVNRDFSPKILMFRYFVCIVPGLAFPVNFDNFPLV